MAEQKQEESKECPSIKIIYFPFSGRAGPLRLAAAIGGIKFEDEFVADFDAQNKNRADGHSRWVGLPEVRVYDKDGNETLHIGQSNACLRYIGKITGLYPSDPFQAALCDEVCDSIEDVLNATLKIALHSKDENDKKAKADEFVKPDGSLRYWLDRFVSRIEENAKRGNTKGYFVGDSLTIADIKAVNFAFYVSGMIAGADDKNGVLSEDKYQPIMDVVSAVKSNENAKAYIEEFEKRQNVIAMGEGLKQLGIMKNYAF